MHKNIRTNTKIHCYNSPFAIVLGDPHIFVHFSCKGKMRGWIMKESSNSPFNISFSLKEYVIFLYTWTVGSITSLIIPFIVLYVFSRGWSGEVIK